MMKFLTTIILCLLSLGATGQTATSASASTGKEGRSILRLVSKPSNHKRVPSRLFMEAVYTEGSIVIHSQYDIQIAALIIENVHSGETQILSDVIIGENKAINLDCGQYLLTAERPDGGCFIGTLTVN